MKPLTLALMLLLSACTNPPYKGPKSDHFNGKTFFNPGHPPSHGFLSVLKWRFLEKEPRPEWPEHVAIPPAPTPAPRIGMPAGQAPKTEHRKPNTDLIVTPLGHASILIQTDNLNILTDPVFTERASPFSFMGPRRVTPLPFPKESLPHIDVVLISHSHYDHLSLPTLKWLIARDNPRIITPLGVNTLISGGNTTALDWGQSLALSNTTTAHFHAVQHWSARTPWDRNETLWGGYTLTTPAGNILFAGDTGYGGGWWSKPLGEKFGPYQLALLPVGAYAPRWFMEYSHMNPEEAVQAAQDVKAKNILGIHWGTFRLTDEAREEPPTRLAAALSGTTYTSASAKTLNPGQPWNLSPNP